MSPALTRRDFLQGLLVSSAALGTASCGGGGRAPDGPNVVFLAIDDLNNWVGCLGHPDARTPNIDALAAGGVLFTHAYCPAPLCHPSRVAVLTGLVPSTTGIYTNEPPLREVLPDAVTLPEHFMAGRYRAAGAGKVFHAGIPPDLVRRLPWRLARYGTSRYWGVWDAFRFAAPDPRPAARPSNGVDVHLDWHPLDVPDEAMSDFRLARWAADRLREPRDGPFFLACGLRQPHPPWYVPARDFDAYDPEGLRLPPVREGDWEDLPPMARWMADFRGHPWYVEVESRALVRAAVHGYLAAVRFADRCVGVILDALAEGPHARDTWVVLWSDHGWHLGEKLRWGKGTLWEESCHVPLVVAGPGAPAGVPCTRPASLTDLYPTLIELCGLGPREGLDGESLAPLVRDPTGPRERPALSTFLPRNHSLRSERWRYTRYADGSEELYDHARDPQEWENRAGDPALAGVKADLARWLPASDARDRREGPTLYRELWGDVGEEDG